jgi:shikimate 5-dehydrogenase
MLLHQGTAAFTIWTGKPAPTEVMRKALEEALYAGKS